MAGKSNARVLRGLVCNEPSARNLKCGKFTLLFTILGGRQRRDRDRDETETETETERGVHSQAQIQSHTHIHDTQTHKHTHTHTHTHTTHTIPKKRRKKKSIQPLLRCLLRLCLALGIWEWRRIW